MHTGEVLSISHFRYKKLVFVHDFFFLHNSCIFSSSLKFLWDYSDSNVVVFFTCLVKRLVRWIPASVSSYKPGNKIVNSTFLLQSTVFCILTVCLTGSGGSLFIDSSHSAEQLQTFHCSQRTAARRRDHNAHPNSSLLTNIYFRVTPEDPPHLLWIVTAPGLSAAGSGATTLNGGLEKSSSICEPEALHGCRLRQAVTGDAEGTFVLGILSPGLALIYNKLFIVLKAPTIFGDTLRH